MHMTDNKRTSERLIPRGSDEDVVIIEYEGRQSLAKMLDLSDGGTLVYFLSNAEDSLGKDAACELTLYHQGKMFAIGAKVARAHGRLLAFQFGPIHPESLPHLQAKLIRLEVDWRRLKVNA
jgi:hypothetical protein